MFNPYMQYNPYVQTQQRGYPYQQQAQYPQQIGQFNPPIQPVQPAVLKGRAVTSYDEAKAAMIDLDGSVYIFPDINNKVIYTKQINLDGTASLNTYALVPVQNSSPQEPGSPNPSQNLGLNINPLLQEIASLKDDFRTLREEVKSYVQSCSNDGHDSKPKADGKLYAQAKSASKPSVPKSNADG